MTGSFLDTVTIPESVLKVWRETEWEIDGDGRIRTPKTCRCPLVEACISIAGSVWANGDYFEAAADLGIDDENDADLIAYIADNPDSQFRPEFEQLLGLRV